MKTKKKTRQAVKKLPYVPSKLIRLVVRDIEKCEKLPEQYQIDMDVWWNVGTKGEPCVVCAAGAVMAQTLKSPHKVFRGVVPENYSEHNHQALYAIDSFSRGLVVGGINDLGLEAPSAKCWKWQIC